MSEPVGWNTRYQKRETPWDLDGPSPSLRAALDLGMLHGLKRVLVPGCGLGHDVELLAERGHEPLGVDMAPTAIERLRERVDARPDSVSVEAEVGDVFTLPQRHAEASFDAVFEYTCFCAIDPADRPRYAATMTHLVRPGGRLLFLVFPTHRDVEGGPPFAVTLEDVRAHFDEGWVERFVSPSQVAPGLRAGREWVALLERRAP